MDIQVSKNFIENSCTVEETVLIIDFDNSDDPDSKKEDASETNPTPEEENVENDPEEVQNKEQDNEANKVTDIPQFQQHQTDCAFASVSRQYDTQGKSDQKLFMTRQNIDDKDEIKEAEKNSLSMRSERKQDLSESDSSSLDDEFLCDFVDDEYQEMVIRMMEIDLTFELVDQMKEELSDLPCPRSVDHLTIEEIEEEILKIELECSRTEALARETELGQDMTPVPRVSANVQVLIPTETESPDEDTDLTDLNYGRHVSYQTFESESGRVNPIPRHYYSEDCEEQKRLEENVKQDIRSKKKDHYSEDCEEQKRLEENVKQDIRSRKKDQVLHRPEPKLASATDHLTNIHEHDDTPVLLATQSKPSSECEDDKQDDATLIREVLTSFDPLTNEAIERPTNQIDYSENSTIQVELEFEVEDRPEHPENLFDY